MLEGNTMILTATMVPSHGPGMERHGDKHLAVPYKGPPSCKNGKPAQHTASHERPVPILHPQIPAVLYPLIPPYSPLYTFPKVPSPSRSISVIWSTRVVAASALWLVSTRFMSSMRTAEGGQRKSMPFDTAWANWLCRTTALSAQHMPMLGGPKYALGRSSEHNHPPQLLQYCITVLGVPATSAPHNTPGHAPFKACPEHPVCRHLPATRPRMPSVVAACGPKPASVTPLPARPPRTFSGH